MHALYNIAILVATFLTWASQSFSKKMRLFVQGRTKTFTTLEKQLDTNLNTIWFHCASLGEFEQGLPIMKAVKKNYPAYQIVVTFFSPSGYEVKKNTDVADVVVYLPLDTKRNARRFISIVRPKMALFIKYEFWPNYLFALQEKSIPAILVSASFRKNQIFFKSYGSFMRRALHTFEHIFVQNKASETLLESVGFKNITQSGDTRFDRVSQQISTDNTLPFIEEFKKDQICIVCGSTWPADEKVLLPYLNSSNTALKFIIAPHVIDQNKISNFEAQLTKKYIRYSNYQEHEASTTSANILIIDSIGVLSKIYSYADIAFIGGAMGNTGLHNILEAATFGIPIVIGKNYDKFPEAKRLQSLAGLFSVQNPNELKEIMYRLVNDKTFRTKTGMIAGHFVDSNTGATEQILSYIIHRLGKG